MPAVGVVFTMDGVDRLRDMFKQIPEAIQRPLGVLERNTAFAVKARAQALAPKDQGDLVNAIAAQQKGKTWVVGVIDVSLPSRGGNSAHQNPSVYGTWYEFGFTTRKIARHPFMHPAADETLPYWERGLEALAREIENIMGRLAD